MCSIQHVMASSLMFVLLGIITTCAVQDVANSSPENEFEQAISSDAPTTTPSEEQLKSVSPDSDIMARQKREPPVIIYKMPPKYYGPPRRRPKPIYGPPRPVYGPPKPKPVYGPPSFKPAQPIYGPPSSAYGPQLPFGSSYGSPPIDSYGPPTNSWAGSSTGSGSYGPHLSISPSYGGAHSSYRPPSSFPTSGFGSGYGGSPPPKTGYGPPPTDNYGPPANNYGPPANNYGPPSNNYGPPSNNYGPPSSGYGTPSNTYGTPSSTYGIPSNTYGSPPSSTYGVVPGTSYPQGNAGDGVLDNGYEPLPSNYGTPMLAYDSSSASYGTPGAVNSYGIPLSQNDGGHHQPSAHFSSLGMSGYGGGHSKRRHHYDYNDSHSLNTNVVTASFDPHLFAPNNPTDIFGEASSNKFEHAHKTPVALQGREKNHNYDGPGVVSDNDAEVIIPTADPTQTRGGHIESDVKRKRQGHNTKNHPPFSTRIESSVP